MKYKELRKRIEQLYFVEGLEDIRFLHCLNEKALKKWCENKGEKLCQILFYEIIMERKPSRIIGVT